MAIYKLTAERVRDKESIAYELRKKFGVEMYGNDPVFSSMFIVVISGTSEDADKARDMLWQYNSGAYCGIAELTEDEFDAMC